MAIEDTLWWIFTRPVRKGGGVGVETRPMDKWISLQIKLLDTKRYINYSSISKNAVFDNFRPRFVREEFSSRTPSRFPLELTYARV